MCRTGKVDISQGFAGRDPVLLLVRCVNVCLIDVSMWFRTGISETVEDARCVFCYSGQDLKKVKRP